MLQTANKKQREREREERGKRKLVLHGTRKTLSLHKCVYKNANIITCSVSVAAGKTIKFIKYNKLQHLIIIVNYGIKQLTALANRKLFVS